MSLNDLIEADRQTRSSSVWYKSFMEQQTRDEQIFHYVKPVFDAYEYYRNQYLLSQLQDELKRDSAGSSSLSQPGSSDLEDRFRRLEISLDQKTKQIESQQALLNDLQSQLSSKETEIKDLTLRLSLATSQSAQLQLQVNSTHKLLEEKMSEIVRLNDELRAIENIDKMELVEKIDRSEEASTAADPAESSLGQMIPKRVVRTLKVPGVDSQANFISSPGNSCGTFVVGSRSLYGLDTQSGETRFEIEAPGSTVLCASISTDNEIGIMGTGESQLTVFEIMSKRILKDLKGHNGKIKGCGFLGNRAKAFSVATDRTMKLWDLNRGGPIRSVPVVSQLVHGVCSADGSLIVTGHLNGKIALWTQSDKVCELSAHTESSMGVALSADGRYVSSLGKDGSVCIFDVNMAQAGPLHTLRGFNSPSTDSAPAFSPDSRMVAACTAGAVSIWDCISGRPLKQLQSDASGVCWVYDKFSRESILVTSHALGVIKWWTP